MSNLISEEKQQALREAMDKVLVLIKDAYSDVVATEDPTAGRPHSHGEVNNPRGLALRALSLALTNSETASMWMIRSFFTDQGEYTPLQKLKKA